MQRVLFKTDTQLLVQTYAVAPGGVCANAFVCASPRVEMAGAGTFVLCLSAGISLRDLRSTDASSMNVWSVEQTRTRRYGLTDHICPSHLHTAFPSSAILPPSASRLPSFCIFSRSLTGSHVSHSNSHRILLLATYPLGTMPLFPKVTGFLRPRARTSAEMFDQRPSTAPSEAIGEYVTVNSCSSQAASPVGALASPPSPPVSSNAAPLLDTSVFPAPTSPLSQCTQPPSPFPSASTHHPTQPAQPAQWWDDEPTRSASALAILQRWLESPESMSTEPALLALAHPLPPFPSLNGYVALCEEIYRFNSKHFPPDSFVALKLYLGLLDQ